MPWLDATDPKVRAFLRAATQGRSQRDVISGPGSVLDDTASFEKRWISHRELLDVALGSGYTQDAVRELVQSTLVRWQLPQDDTSSSADDEARQRFRAFLARLEYEQCTQSLRKQATAPLHTGSGNRDALLLSQLLFGSLALGAFGWWLGAVLTDLIHEQVVDGATGLRAVPLSWVGAAVGVAFGLSLEAAVWALRCYRSDNGLC